MNNKELILKMLADGEITVSFTKKDGTSRVMRCTRSLALIPTEAHPKSNDVKTDSDVIPVYDLDAAGWRSFDINNLQDN